MNREAIYSALFALLSTAEGFKTIGRRLKAFTEVPPTTSQPALFQVQKREIAEQLRGAPTKWRMEIDLYIYCSTPDKSVSPTTTLNPLIQAVEMALGFDAIIGTQTLNDLVSHCWMTSIEYFEGVQDTLSVAVISLEILTTNP